MPDVIETAELTTRQIRERQHHDRWAHELDPDRLLINQHFEALTAKENRFILAFFGDLRGRRILDVAAGAGEAALYFAAQGAEVTALDISAGQLAVLEKAAAARGLTVNTVCGPAETMPFADGSFDFVYGNGALHHMDNYQTVLHETVRVLAPGGKMAWIEPLAYNPVIWAYRALANAVRTPDERPLRHGDLLWMQRHLPNSQLKFFWISSLMVFVYMFAIERVMPWHERYWKRLLRLGDRYHRVAGPFNQLDRLLGKLPVIKWMAWNSVILGQKR